MFCCQKNKLKLSDLCIVTGITVFNVSFFKEKYYKNIFVGQKKYQ